MPRFIGHLRAQVGSFDDKGIDVCRWEDGLVSADNDELSGDQWYLEESSQEHFLNLRLFGPAFTSG